MKTTKPLLQLVPDILRHIEDWKQNLEFNFRIYKLLNGQIKKEIEDSLSKELISRAAFNRAIQRIPSLNILDRTATKISRIYVEPPMRRAKNETDKDILANIEREAKINKSLHTANKFYNALYSFALEPYIEDGKHQVRVLAPHQFLVYSDSRTNKSKHTVFIKLLDSRSARILGRERPSRDGKRQDTDKRPELVDVFALYSDTEFLIVDATGAVREDIMQEIGATTRNDFGRIPFVYGKKTATELMPYPNQPGFDFSILIPKLLTDLNYSARFCSHSITWTKNVKLNNQELNPDAIVDLGDTDPDGAAPEIGTINPTVDVQNQLALVDYQFIAHLDSLGIKASNESLSNGRDASGLAKAIDSADVSNEVLNQQNNDFMAIEQELWELLADMQNVWTRRSDVVEKRVFTTAFKDEFSVDFSDIKVMPSLDQQVNYVKSLRDLKLMSRAQAIKSLHPQWTMDEVKAWIEELDEEAEENMQRIMDGMESLNGETKSDGTFQEGNQVGANQTPDSKNPERV